MAVAFVEHAADLFKRGCELSRVSVALLRSLGALTDELGLKAA